MAMSLLVTTLSLESLVGNVERVHYLPFQLWVVSGYSGSTLRDAVPCSPEMEQPNSPFSLLFKAGLVTT